MRAADNLMCNDENTCIDYGISSNKRTYSFLFFLFILFYIIISHGVIPKIHIHMRILVLIMVSLQIRELIHFCFLFILFYIIISHGVIPKIHTSD